jgi:hypothetical protein
MALGFKFYLLTGMEGNKNYLKAIPVEAWTSPEGCSRLRLPDL